MLFNIHDNQEQDITIDDMPNDHPIWKLVPGKDDEEIARQYEDWRAEQNEVVSTQQ